MPAVIPGYTYDVFVSYRHKDNKYDGWVTEFVANLKKELEATIKEDVSVYFDENADDGLRESHEVSDSLRQKLKCLVFVPIVSQTYCDPKSFAWRHEFLAFRDQASADDFGLKIKLANGNVASRILPIRIHEIDSEDKELLERELGAVVRPIDFVYRSAGVNRPLRPKEEEANEAHTTYRNQINKVANAIKELVQGMKTATSRPVSLNEPRAAGWVDSPVKPKTRKTLAYVSATALLLLLASYLGYAYFSGEKSTRLSSGNDKSIAVIPFVNMSDSKEQEFFSDGITEDILNHLVKISELKVKSRTSTLQYKGTKKSISLIGEELGVANIVEGSVRRAGNRVKIVVQLIDTKNDVHLWSETYDRELEDVLTLQSEIAIEIARALEAQLSRSERASIERESSTNITAYDYFLKARQMMDYPNPEKRIIENAISLVNNSIALDPDFAPAYALKGDIWATMRMFGAKLETWRDSSLFYTTKAIEIDPLLPEGYLSRAWIRRYFGEVETASQDYKQAFAVAPNDPYVLEAYGYELLRKKDEKGAELILKSIDALWNVTDPQYYLGWDDALYYLQDQETREALLRKSKSISPGSVWPYIYLSALYIETNQPDKALPELEEAMKINPNFQSIHDQMAWHYFNKGDYKKAISFWENYKTIEKTFDDTTQVIPFRHRAGMAYAKLGDKKKADLLFAEQRKICNEMLTRQRGIGAWGNMGTVLYDLAVCESYFGNHDVAIKLLDSAVTKYKFFWLWGINNDPMLKALEKDSKFLAVRKKVTGDYDFRKEAFTKAINRLEASADLQRLLK